MWPSSTDAESFMPTKTVLDVGNCGPDHASIKSMLEDNFDVQVLQSNETSDTLVTLAAKSVDLVLINRKLDTDYSDGVEVLKAIRADGNLDDIPVMLVTNHTEHQQAAIEQGAVRGFGKLALNDPQTISNLTQYLN